MPIGTGGPNYDSEPLCGANGAVQQVKLRAGPLKEWLDARGIVAERQVGLILTARFNSLNRGSDCDAQALVTLLSLWYAR